MIGERLRLSRAVFLFLCLLGADCAGRRPPAFESRGLGSPDDTAKYVVVVKDYANLRAADSGRAAILRKLPQGAHVLVLTRNGKWYQVLEEESNALGWVHETYVEEIQR